MHVLDDDGRTVAVTADRPDADALRTHVDGVARHGQAVTAVESMSCARFVHDQLELLGWGDAIAKSTRRPSIEQVPHSPHNRAKTKTPLPHEKGPCHGVCNRAHVKQVL